MSNKFNQKEVEHLLAKCHRRCCICHRFCGVKIETDHIIQPKDGGDNSIANAIPVCFECHAEIHSYNPDHPRGRKFKADELKLHKEQWLEICKVKPEIFISAKRDADVGPLQALIDELDFNLAITKLKVEDDYLSCMFLDDQFRRAINEGAISVIKENLKVLINDAYIIMRRANQEISSAMNTAVTGGPFRAKAAKGARDLSKSASSKIESAKNEIIKFLSND